MSDFDPKLNSENLNKCLLSLKEFYRDLRHQKVKGRTRSLALALGPGVFQIMHMVT